MYLYLVQHAEARPKETDPDRHLSEKGSKMAERMVTYLARNADMSLNRILHSPKTRAVETAGIFYERLKPEGGMEEATELSPMSTPWGWVERLSQLEENIMIVGHLPHLQRLSSILLCQDEHQRIIEFEKGCVICLFRDDSGIWAVRWMLTPSVLPA
ncbi:MAG: phosphohistidine phosphatase SixA [Spirochaetes bacterium]|nr:phosphohistidine phosphatase SixA [Spirochaetota bacterium]